MASPKLFEDPDLALCVIEALVAAGYVETSIVVPMLEPEDDDDLDDESESWRDRVVNNQTEPIKQLVALVELHRDLLPKLEELSCVLVNVAEEYEPDLFSLSGIEACTGLKRVEIWSSDPKLDLTPLTALPKLASVDLECAGKLKNFRPLLEIASLRDVVSSYVDDRTAAELRKRNVDVKTNE